MGSMNFTCCRFMPARVSVAFLIAGGIISVYISRVAISIAILAMVTITDSSSNSSEIREPFCLRTTSSLRDYKINNSLSVRGEISDNLTDNEAIDAPEFNSVMFLSTTQRGIVLGAFFYGYLTTGIAGGFLADKFGTKKVFGIAVLLDSIANLFIPLAAKTHYILLIGLRFLIGVFQGVSYPAVQSSISRWSPKEERSMFISFTFIANCLGIILTMSISGVLISHLGWEIEFYLTSGIGFFWLIIWILFMYDSPEVHPRISIKEKEYIQNSIASCTRDKPKSVPWKKMLTNVPLWAITITHCGNMFGFILLITQLPIFMSSIMGLAIKENALLSAIPFIARFIGSNSWCLLDSFLIRKKYFKVLYQRKFFNSLGMFCPAILILSVAYIGCNPYGAMALFTTALFVNGATISGYSVNWLDVAPNFAGTSLGLSNTCAFAFTTSAPIIVGALTPDEGIGVKPWYELTALADLLSSGQFKHQPHITSLTVRTMAQWQIVFWLTSITYIVTGIFFLIFASDESQSWNYNEVQVKENLELRS